MPLECGTGTARGNRQRLLWLSGIGPKWTCGRFARGTCSRCARRLRIVNNLDTADDWFFTLLLLGFCCVFISGFRLDFVTQQDDGDAAIFFALRIFGIEMLAVGAAHHVFNPRFGKATFNQNAAAGLGAVG